MDSMSYEPSGIHRDSVSRPHSPKGDSSAPRSTIVCVFCGSSPGASPAHLAAARSLAHAFHANNVKLVFGGGTHGLMGELARTLASLSGPDAVHGIIPKALIAFEQQGRPTQQDVASEEEPKVDSDEKCYGRTTVVPNMHVRKQAMAKEVLEGGPGSGFIALSGGYGTLEELAEIATWNQLGIHQAGVIIFNVEGYYDGLIQWIKGAVTGGFISPGNASIIVEALSAEECVTKLRDYKVAEGRLNLDWTEK